MNERRLIVGCFIAAMYAGAVASAADLPLHPIAAPG
jgi:hypothetical protein